MNFNFDGKIEHIGKIAGRKHWEKILNKWRDISENYCRLHHGDLPFWFTERSDLSQLAGAIWKTNGHALEEYSAVKGHGRSQRNGRVDLYFKFNDGFCIIIEAKKCWRNAISSITSEINAAEKDAKESKKSEGISNAIALVFQSPSFSKELTYEEKRIEIKSKNDEIMTEIKPDILAWFTELRRSYWGGKNKDQLYFVGRIIGKRINS